MKGIMGLVFWSAIGLAPVASGLVIASLIRRRDHLTALAPVTAFIGWRRLPLNRPESDPIA